MKRIYLLLLLPFTLARAEDTTNWEFRLKKNFYSFIIVRTAQDEFPPTGAPQDYDIPMVRFGEIHPNIDLPFYTLKSVPSREASAKKKYGLKFLGLLNGTWLSPNRGPRQEDPIPLDHEQLQKLIFTEGTATIYPPPTVPQALKERGSNIENADVFGAVAPSSPLSNYMQKLSEEEAKKIEGVSPQELFAMDLRALDRYPTKEGKSILGARAILRYDPVKKSFHTLSIDYLGKNIPYDDTNEEFIKAKKVMACSLATHTTVIPHLTESHILVAGHFSGAVINNFNSTHPLRALLERHGQGVFNVNNYAIPILIGTNGSSVTEFTNFSDETAQQIMKDHMENFQLESLDVNKEWRDRGMINDKGALVKDSRGGDINFPFYQMSKDYWDLIANYLTKAINYIYPSEKDLQEDQAVASFYKDLEKYFAKGIKGVTKGKRSKSSLIKLLSIYLHTSIFRHEVVGNVTKNYTVNFEYFPTTVNENGCNPSVNEVYRNLLTKISTDKENVPTTDGKPLIATIIDDVSEIVTKDSQLQTIMKEFKNELINYEKKIKEKNSLLDPSVVLPGKCQDAVNQ